MRGLIFSLVFLMVLTSCSQTAFTEQSISNGNDVFASFINADELLVIRQEPGIEHIRGYNTELILHNLNSGDTVLFESGVVPGMDDSERQIVIDGPPMYDGDVVISVIEAKSTEFMPQNTMYALHIDLDTMEQEFEMSEHKKETQFDEEGNVVAHDTSSREIEFDKGVLRVDTDFSIASKKVYFNDELIVDMDSAHNFFFNENAITYEKDGAIYLAEFGGTPEIAIDSQTKKNVKGVYGITDENELLVESNENAFFLFKDGWQLITKSEPGISIRTPKFNSMGNIIYEDKIVLKKLNEATGNSELFVYTKTGGGKVYSELPMFGVENSKGDEELVVGSRKGNLAPDFELTDINGHPVTISDEKYTVLFAWATWCSQCTKEFKSIKAAYDKVGSNNVNFVAVNIDLSENDDMIRDYIEQKDLQGLNFAMADFDLLQNYKIRSTTTKIIIDKNGVIQYVASGVLSPEHWETIFSI